MGLEHGKDATGAGGVAGTSLGQRMAKGQGDRPRPPEQLLQGAPALPAAPGIPGEEGLGCLGSASPQRAEGLPCSGTIYWGVCAEPQSPTFTWLDSSSTPCAQHKALQSSQSCCHRDRAWGHGAPARPGCRCHPQGTRGTLRAIQDSRGEMAQPELGS